MSELRRYFGEVDGRGSYWAKQQRLFAKQRDASIRRDRIEDQADADFAAFAAGAVMATDAQIREFEVKLEKYETATVKALQENDRAIDANRAQRDALLERAHVAEDGRRVFKTQDGTQVFDEHGGQVGDEIVSPDEIDDSRPTWEEYEPILAETHRLEAERQSILKYQQKLDEARGEIADGEISAEELEALDAELAEIMPPAVREHIPEMKAQRAPEASTTATASALAQKAAATLDL
ncbi:MAG: hypothetical protein AAFS03_04775 [Pseudomonadota bacterium]